jgi:hypothetical protein
MMTRNIECVIERRLLVNYRISADQVAAVLPGLPGILACRTGAPG